MPSSGLLKYFGLVLYLDWLSNNYEWIIWSGNINKCILPIKCQEVVKPVKLLQTAFKKLPNRSETSLAGWTFRISVFSIHVREYTTHYKYMNPVLLKWGHIANKKYMQLAAIKQNASVFWDFQWEDAERAAFGPP